MDTKQIYKGYSSTLWEIASTGSPNDLKTKEKI
jgi:hypothetical protein